jgi:hypothetical protein
MHSLAKIEQFLAEADSAISRDEGRLAQIQSDLDFMLTNQADTENTLDILNQVMGIFQGLEESWHHSFEEKLAGLISRGLTYVFQEDMEFVLEGKTHGDLSALEFKLVQKRQDGSRLTTDILGAKGGGVVGMVGFLLRLIVVLTMRPSLRRVIFFDETFSHLSREYVPSLAQLLRMLCDETDVQFVMITHEPAFTEAADVVYRVAQTDGVTEYILEPRM